MGASLRRGGYPRGRGRRIFTRNRALDGPGGPRMLIAIACLIVVCLGGTYAISSMRRHAAEVAAQEREAVAGEKDARQDVDLGKLGIGLLPASTPRSKWERGSMPHLYQTDPAWAGRPFAGGTVRINACGPTSLAMVYIYLTGRTDMDPASMSAFADEHNFAPTGATEWAFMSKGANMLGLNSLQIHRTRGEIAQSLAHNHPVICSVQPGDFTTVGHYIVLKSIDDRGMVEVFDPNSPYNSARRWAIGRIINQTNACWSLWA